MRYYIRTWIAFFSGANVIKVTNENEFNIFKKFLDDCGVLDLLKDDLTLKNSIDYYGENPIEVSELKEFLNRRTIENNKSNLEKDNENYYDYN